MNESDGVKVLRELADILEQERKTVQDLQEGVQTVLKWCHSNIETGTTLTPFCVQVRDILEPLING